MSPPTSTHLEEVPKRNRSIADICAVKPQLTNRSHYSMADSVPCYSRTEDRRIKTEKKQQHFLGKTKWFQKEFRQNVITQYGNAKETGLCVLYMQSLSKLASIHSYRLVVKLNHNLSYTKLVSCKHDNSQLEEALNQLWYFNFQFQRFGCGTYEPRQANLCLRAFRHDKF